MDPERWRRIEELYQSAVDSDVAERATLLAHADPEMRREVESLLAQPTAGTPLDRSAFSALDRRMVVEKALEKDPAERYQTAREMVIDLRRASRQTGSGDAAETRPPEKTGDGSRALEISGCSP